MNNILKKAAIGVMSLALTASVLPAQTFEHDNWRGDQVQTASWRDENAYKDRTPYGYDRYELNRHEGRDYYGSDYRGDHRGRDAAIVAGSAVGGAVIGAAVGHGEGAVAGAIVGGIGGLIADEAVRQHDYRR